MKNKIVWQWALGTGAAGMALALLMVAALRVTHSQFILFLIYSWDRLAVPMAASVTSLVFPDDLAQRAGVSIETFFETLLILGAGLQCSLVGFLIGLALKTKHPANPMSEDKHPANPMADSLK
ncbi:MAG TPA: hypothetical protein VM578_00970 [Candidatus Saccharimonadales bacterium]|nr:hypothetical protein [Candidatus Saccharimonadales bacterium]